MDQLQMHMLSKVADLHAVPEGAYNIRDNGALAGRNTTANIDIVSKKAPYLLFLILVAIHLLASLYSFQNIDKLYFSFFLFSFSLYSVSL